MTAEPCLDARLFVGRNDKLIGRQGAAVVLTGVEIENPEYFLHGLLMVRVRGVAFLPKEFRRAQEHARAQFPADHVGPLVEQQRQIEEVRECWHTLAPSLLEASRRPH